MASSEGFRNEKRETVLRTLWGGRATLELLETAQISPARGGNDSVRESIWFPGSEWGRSGICMLQGGERGGSGVCMLQGGEWGGSESLEGSREGIPTLPCKVGKHIHIFDQGPCGLPT